MTSAVEHAERYAIHARPRVTSEIRRTVSSSTVGSDWLLFRSSRWLLRGLCHGLVAQSHFPRDLTARDLTARDHLCIIASRVKLRLLVQQHDIYLQLASGLSLVT